LGYWVIGSLGYWAEGSKAKAGRLDKIEERQNNDPRCQRCLRQLSGIIRRFRYGKEKITNPPKEGTE
jgi:hypothetical protein